MQPHRLVGQGLHHSQLHHPVRQQAQFPVVVALRGWAAGQGNEMGLRPLVQLPVPPGLDSILQRSLQPILGEAPLEAEHRALAHIQGLGHPGRRPPLVGLQQDPGPGRSPGSTLPCPNHMLQLVPFFRRQPDRKFLPDHTATSQLLQLLKDYHYRSTTKYTIDNQA